MSSMTRSLRRGVVKNYCKRKYGNTRAFKHEWNRLFKKSETKPAKANNVTTKHSSLMQKIASLKNVLKNKKE